MEGTPSKAEAMKPLFLKAGVPLVLSVAGFLYARILAKKGMNNNMIKCANNQEPMDDDHELSIQNDVENHMIVNSHFLSSSESSDVCKVNYEEEMLGLRNKFEDLQKREWELERKFIWYCDMKEQELVLMELRNVLISEAAPVEFLDKQISAMEAERQRFEKLVVGWIRVVEQIELVKLENRLLQRKEKKFIKKMQAVSRVVREKNLKIEAAEGEIVRFSKEVEMRSNVIRKLEEQVTELQGIVNQLQEEKNEILIKLNSAENPASSYLKNEAEGLNMETQKENLDEIEEIHKEKADAELIYLRWTNACLRHELMRSHEQQQEIEEQKTHLELELEGNKLHGHGDCSLDDHPKSRPGSGHYTEQPFLDVANTSSQDCSKRKKFLKRLKKWVEGNDHLKSKLDEKVKHEINCLGRFSVSENSEELDQIHSRRSCSSA